jgi:hypothetical protein
MHGGKRAGSGRKKVDINLREVEKLAALQCTDEELAAWFHVNPRTIERRRQHQAFAEAIECGRALGRLSVRRKLFALANKGNVAANIFLAKNLLGYRDAVRNEHSGPDGRPIPIEALPDLSNLSAEEFAQFQTLMDKTLGETK